MTIVTQQQLANAALDVKTIEDVANGSSSFNGTGLVTSRLGTVMKTMAKVIADKVAAVFDDAPIRAYLLKENLFRNPRWMDGYNNIIFQQSEFTQPREIRTDASVKFGYEGKYLRVSCPTLNNAAILPNINHIKNDPELISSGYINVEIEYRSDYPQDYGLYLIKVPVTGASETLGAVVLNAVNNPRKAVIRLPLNLSNIQSLFLNFFTASPEIMWSNPLDIGRINIYGGPAVNQIEFLSDKIRYENAVAVVNALHPSSFVNLNVTGILTANEAIVNTSLTTDNLNVLAVPTGITFEDIEGDPRDNAALDAELP